MQAEIAIADWARWNAGLHEKPEVVRLLHGGRSNRSYLLRSGQRHLVLRLSGKDTLLPGGSRRSETKIWRAASAAGLAPPLLYADEQQGILLSTYIADKLPAQPEASQAIVEHAFDLLERCHQLDIDAHSMDYRQHIRHYWQLIEAGGGATDLSLVKQRKPMQELLESLRSSGAQTALCHHDPTVANFVGSPDRLYLVDWEYAARGLVVMDYAALAVEWGIDDAVVLARAAVERELLAMAKRLYGYLCALWIEARPGSVQIQEAP